MFTYLKLFKRILDINSSKKKDNSFFLPYKVNFNLTLKCNSFCRTCNIWKQPYEEAKQLSNEDYLKLFQTYHKNLFIASFEGGEPFLRKDLPEIVRSCIKNSPNLLLLLIDSNGSLPDEIEKQVKIILKEKFSFPLYIAFSLDGPESIHNDIRRIENGYALLFESVERLKKIKDKRLQIYFQTTISKRNWASLLDFYKTRKEKWVFSLAHKADLFKNMDSEEDVFSIPEKELFSLFLKNLYSAYRIRNWKDIFNKWYLKYALQYYKSRKTPVKCFAGYATLSIDPFGNVKPCSFSGKIFGNIKDYEFQFSELLNSPNTREILKGIDKQACHCWMNCDALPSILHSCLY